MTSLITMSGSSIDDAGWLLQNVVQVLKDKNEDCSKLVERLANSQKNVLVSSLNYYCNDKDIVANYYLQ